MDPFDSFDIIILSNIVVRIRIQLIYLYITDRCCFLPLLLANYRSIANHRHIPSRSPKQGSFVAAKIVFPRWIINSRLVIKLCRRKHIFEVCDLSLRVSSTTKREKRRENNSFQRFLSTRLVVRRERWSCQKTYRRARVSSGIFHAIFKRVAETSIYLGRRTTKQFPVGEEGA